MSEHAHTTTPPPVRWTTRVLLPLAIAPLAFELLLWPADRAVYDAIRAFKPSGDLRRELEMLGQFGSFGTMLVAFVLMLVFDRERIRRVLDWGLAVILGTILFNGMKILIGRARPVLGDPYLFMGPTGERTTPSGEVLTALSGASELHAMPSSHTTHAVIAAVFLGAMYPRLRPVVYAWAGLVGLLRVLHGAHWPSDVVVGALIAYPLAYVIVTRYWGVRGLDWCWRAFIDKDATPEFPNVIAREERATG